MTTNTEPSHATRCHACRSPLASEINSRLVAGESPEKVSAWLDRLGVRFALSAKSIRLHETRHVPAAAPSTVAPEGRTTGDLSRADLAKLVRDIAYARVQSGDLTPTLSEGLRAQEAIDRREQKAQDRDLMLSLAGLLSGAVQPVAVSAPNLAALPAPAGIQPGKAAWILQNLGTEQEYVEKVVKTEIRGSGRRVPTKFAAYDLYTKKSYDAQQALFDEISPKFEENGLILDEIVIRNITFTPEYTKTLEEKQIALENITTEKNKLEQEKIRKEQKIVEAEGDAKSFEIRQAALTKNPTIIQWEFVQKLAPNIQWGIMPDKVIPIIDFKNMAGPQK